MLEVDAHTFRLESTPEEILVHAIGLFGPLTYECISRRRCMKEMLAKRGVGGGVRTSRELILVGLEFLLELPHLGGVFVEQNLAFRYITSASNLTDDSEE